MKKTTTMMLCLVAACACGDTKITWLADVTADRAETVTGAQSNAVAAAAAHIPRTDNPHGVTAAQIGALTAELDPVANAKLVIHTNRIDNPHGVTAVQIGAITAELDPVANAALTVHTNRTDNPHGVTAAQIGALTAEQDLAALRTYHYGSPDIVESPAEWFVFDGAGTITAFNWAAGRENVVIPWAIGGVPVTAIGAYAFAYTSAESVIAPQTVTMTGEGAFVSCLLLTSINLPQATSIGDSTFSGCSALTSVTVPQVTSIGEYVFSYCLKLTSVHMGRNAPAEATSVFYGITPPPTVHVTDPQATGWGATWNGATVVRPPLCGSNVTARAFTLGGDTITEWPSSSVPYTAWTGTVTPVGGTATITAAHGNMPVLVVPDGGGITYVTIATDTYAATSGVSRVSLSIWAGENTVEFLTDEVDYATAPDIPTDGWGTILFRRVSNGKWKGVGL